MNLIEIRRFKVFFLKTSFFQLKKLLGVSNMNNVSYKKYSFLKGLN